jgi:hypothetical protein
MFWVQGGPISLRGVVSEIWCAIYDNVKGTTIQLSFGLGTWEVQISGEEKFCCMWEVIV